MERGIERGVGEERGSGGEREREREREREYSRQRGRGNSRGRGVTRDGTQHSMYASSAESPSATAASVAMITVGHTELQLGSILHLVMQSAFFSITCSHSRA